MTRIAVFGPLGVHLGGRGIGGVATHTERLATALAAQGHHVAVIADDVAGSPGVATSAPWGSRFGALNATARACAPVAPTLMATGARALVDARRSALGIPLARCVKRSTLLASALRAFRPDVLHVQQPDYRPLYADWSGTRVPTLVCAHGGTGGLWTRSHPELDVVVPDNLRRARAIATPSRFLASEVARLAPGAPAASFAANGVDTEVFHPRERAACRYDLGMDQDAPLVVYAGRITQAKGVFDLVAALDRLRESVPDARCVFIGPRDTKDRELPIPLREDAPSSLSSVVPDAEQHQVATWLGAADVVVVPSHYEGFGLAALEAMASSRPVVASAVGGLCELVDDAVGRLVPPGDPVMLANALTDLLLAPVRASAQGATALVRASAYTWDATASRLSEAYDTLLAQT